MATVVVVVMIVMLVLVCGAGGNALLSVVVSRAKEALNRQLEEEAR